VKQESQPAVRAPLPDNEVERLEALKACACLYMPRTERFDRITRLACRLFMAPIALVSIVERERQWFRSVQGMELDSTTRDEAFCSWVVASNKPLFVPDTHADPRFRHNALVLGPPNIRSYAGWPIHIGPGLVAGSLCIIDRVPRTFNPDDQAVLRDLAGLVETEVGTASLSQLQASLQRELSDSDRRSMLDSLTGCWNRHGVQHVMTELIRTAEVRKTSISVFLIEFQGLADINKNFGLGAGDSVLQSWVQQLRLHLPKDIEIGSLGGARFLLMLGGADAERFSFFTALLQAPLPEVAVPSTKHKAPCIIKFGAATMKSASQGDTKEDITQLIQLAEDSLLRAG
jgi:diguanylate cyclase (GGDEF)-like protein